LCGTTLYTAATPPNGAGKSAPFAIDKPATQSVICLLKTFQIQKAKPS
jgi:hypothetical protein